MSKLLRGSVGAHNLESVAARARGRKLKVGILLDTVDIVSWQAVTLRRILDSEYAELTVVATAQHHSSRRLPQELDPCGAAAGPIEAAVAPLLQRIFRALEAKIDADGDAFAPADLASLVRGVAQISVSEQHATALEAFDVDIFLCMGTAKIWPAAATLSKHGLWNLKQPCSGVYDSAVGAFWPVYHGWPVSEANVETLEPTGERRIIVRAFPATHPHSVKLTRANVYWRLTSLLLRKLEQLHRTGYALTAIARVRRAERSTLSELRSPAASQMAMHIARNVARRARASLLRHLSREQWILLYRFGDQWSSSTEGFRKLMPPKDRFWADPHLVYRNGRHYIFFEECSFATGKGHISVIALNPDGTHAPAVKVLERDYHLSYPFIFEHAEQLYMVPESEANRTIDLYRCVDFPLRWELVTSLMRDVRATDSTLLQHHGVWWLFTNLVDMPGASFSEELLLFRADSLTDGDWQAHPLNPVVSDARRSRPAGAIIQRQGRLYRPAQDCSRRYGYGIRIHEITCLDAENYSEREVGAIMPLWDRRIIATHTFSHVSGLTVIDAIQPRLRT